VTPNNPSLRLIPDAKVAINPQIMKRIEALTTTRYLVVIPRLALRSKENPIKPKTSNTTNLGALIGS
jgi:hypothetical protein